jgi:lipoprotein-anchoring transpeptidase ErfK/SrfK
MRTAAKMVVAAVVIAVARARAQAPARVVVSIPDRKLAVVEDGRVVKVFATAVGAAVSPSPSGTFTVVTRIPNPTWYHPGKVVGPGRTNPLGTRWLGLSAKGFGIHGTNSPRSIGRAASHGCIRLRNSDIEELFEMVRVGDVVELHGERDETVEQIFGGELIASAGGR